MTIAIAQPTRSTPRQEYRQPKPELIDRVLQGLQIANSAYGIYANYQNIEQAKAAAERQQQQLELQQEQAARQKALHEQQLEVGRIGLDTAKQEQAGIMPLSTFQKSVAGGKFRPVEEDRPGAVMLRVQGTEPDTVEERHVLTSAYEDREASAEQSRINADRKKLQSSLKMLLDKSQRDEETKQRVLDNTLRLYDRYQRSDITKSTRKLSRFHDQILSFDPQSRNVDPKAMGSAHQAIVVLFARMLDENSVVRESEFHITEQSRGVIESALLLKDKLLGGARVTPEQIVEMKQVASQLMRVQLEVQDQFDAQTRALVNQAGIDPYHVMGAGWAKVHDKIAKNVRPGKSVQDQTPKVQGVTPSDLKQQDEQLTEDDLKVLTDFVKSSAASTQPKPAIRATSRGIILPTSKPTPTVTPLPFGPLRGPRPQDLVRR